MIRRSEFLSNLHAFGDDLVLEAQILKQEPPLFSRLSVFTILPTLVTIIQILS